MFYDTVMTLTMSEEGCDVSRPRIMETMTRTQVDPRTSFMMDLFGSH